LSRVGVQWTAAMKIRWDRGASIGERSVLRALFVVIVRSSLFLLFTRYFGFLPFVCLGPRCGG
jgi:hypothetical protein